MFLWTKQFDFHLENSVVQLVNDLKKKYIVSLIGNEKATLHFYLEAFCRKYLLVIDINGTCTCVFGKGNLPN